MVIFLVESQAAVSARMVAGLIQIDEHSRMTQRSVSAITGDHPVGAQDRRCVRNQIDGELFVDLFLSVQEPRKSVVVFFPHLFDWRLARRENGSA